MALYIGTSGWQYRDWKEAFYPRQLKMGDWLGYYADHFTTVEVNNTFYSLPKTETFARWHVATPSNFTFALKLSRYVTHIKRLKDPQSAVDRFLERAAELKQKIGPLLVQLPPNFSKDIKRLQGLLGMFPRHLRIAVEFRHRSWFDEEVAELLHHYSAALCLADRGSKLQGPWWITGDWTYVRFHYGRSRPEGAYGHHALQSWWQRLREVLDSGKDVYCYFNNDAHCQAVGNAQYLAHLAAVTAPRLAVLSG